MLLFAQIVVNYKQMFRKIITYISGDNVLHYIGVNLLFGRHYIVLSAIPDNYKNKWRRTRPVFIRKIKVKVKIKITPFIRSQIFQLYMFLVR